MPGFETARAWILAHLINRPSVVLHGDLLPPNLLWVVSGELSVIDWEDARLGDPAFDLAMVTRGSRQPLKESGGWQRFLAAYNKTADTHATAVQIHELLLHLLWRAEAAQARNSGDAGGKGPEHYAQNLQAMLRRFAG